MAGQFSFTRGLNSITFDADMLPFERTQVSLQNKMIAEDGTTYVYSRGSVRQFYALKVSVERNSDNFADISDIDEWIANIANFSENTFTLTPPSDRNLGSGDGVEVSVRYWDDELVELSDRTQFYDYNLFLKKED